MVLTKRILFLLFNILVASMTSWCHSSWKEHMDDMMSVLGFEADERLSSWMRYISSDLIDKTDYHKQIRDNYGVDFTSPRKHRYLFHWGYDEKPWSNLIQEEIMIYCEDNGEDYDKLLIIIQEELRLEQKRRNRELNEKTENLLGFAHGGKDASFARFFAAMAYDVHILGDYEPDNTLFSGLQEMNSLIGHIISLMRELDPIVSKPYIKEINIINNQFLNEQIKAKKLMENLKKNVPKLVDKAWEGSVKRRIEKRGFKFSPINYTFMERITNWFN